MTFLLRAESSTMVQFTCENGHEFDFMLDTQELIFDDVAEGSYMDTDITCPDCGTEQLKEGLIR